MNTYDVAASSADANYSLDMASRKPRSSHLRPTTSINMR